MTGNGDQTDRVAKVVASHPFSRHLGAELLLAGDGRAELALPIADHIKQQHGFAHGGAISYLADNAITIAGALALGGDALTGEFKINYLRPGLGEMLIARAEAKHAGSRQATCVCDVYAQSGGEEKLVATALGTVVKIG